MGTVLKYLSNVSKFLCDCIFNLINLIFDIDSKNIHMKIVQV